MGLSGGASTRTGGDIQLGRIEGAGHASTSGGDDKLEQASEPVKLHISGGDFDVSGTAAATR